MTPATSARTAPRSRTPSPPRASAAPRADSSSPVTSDRGALSERVAHESAGAGSSSPARASAVPVPSTLGSRGALAPAGPVIGPSEPWTPSAVSSAAAGASTASRSLSPAGGGRAGSPAQRAHTPLRSAHSHGSTAVPRASSPLRPSSRGHAQSAPSSGLPPGSPGTARTSSRQDAERASQGQQQQQGSTPSTSPPPVLLTNDLEGARQRVARVTEAEVQAAFRWEALPSRHGAAVAYLVRCSCTFPKLTSLLPPPLLS